MNKTIIIKKCPACGSQKIKKVKNNFEGTADGIKYTVSSLEYYECPDCKEKVYDINSMRKIEAVSPAFHKPANHKSAAL